MKLHALAAVVAAATLAQVGASPIRVVVVTSGQELPHLRFGHAAANSPAAKMISIPHSAGFGFVHPQPTGRPPCGKSIKDKAIAISNAFRQALGLPVVEATTPKPGDHIHGGMLHILPFVGGPPKYIELNKPELKGYNRPLDIKMQEDQIHRHSHHQFHHNHQPYRFHQWSDNFWMRIHNALMALGPWEGRVVAFVLGCGIGVLLRMFWVLAVVSYRSIRGGERDDEYTPVAVIHEYVDAEEILVPPPSYTTLNDEKDQAKAKDGAEN